MLYLASTSPRRRDLLRSHGLDYSPVVPGHEPEASGSPLERALERAKAKASGAEMSGLGAGLVLGVDTVVELEGQEFGKPRDRLNAEGMLRALSGREHSVHTGLYLWAWSPDHGETLRRSWSAVETAQVRCAPLSEAVLHRYLEGDDWRDKAGGYGIQADAGSFMTLLDGDLETVIGLPLASLNRLLHLAGGGS